MAFKGIKKTVFDPKHWGSSPMCRADQGNNIKK